MCVDSSFGVSENEKMKKKEVKKMETDVLLFFLFCMSKMSKTELPYTYFPKVNSKTKNKLKFQFLAPEIVRVSYFSFQSQKKEVTKEQYSCYFHTSHRLHYFFVLNKN